MLIRKALLIRVATASVIACSFIASVVAERLVSYRRVRSLFCLAVLGVAQVGCVWIRPGVDNPILLNSKPPFGSRSAVLLPGADYHLVTVRSGPAFYPRGGNKPYPEQDVLCSEPSPDWAIAFGTSLAGAASGGRSGGTSVSLSGNAATTEAITAMLGRTAGVVALGLYSACQAYANQLIGKDAYALILSQYGNLLVALAAGGGGAAASAGSTPSTTPPGVAVAVSAGAPPSASNPSGGSQGNGPTQANNPQVSQMQQQAIQAMLVACISYNDSSIAHADNTLLDQHCGIFMNKLSDALPELLKPPSSIQTASGSPPVPSHAAPPHHSGSARHS